MIIRLLSLLSMLFESWAPPCEVMTLLLFERSARENTLLVDVIREAPILAFRNMLGLFSEFILPFPEPIELRAKLLPLRLPEPLDDPWALLPTAVRGSVVP